MQSLIRETETIVRAVPEPQGTKTWNPISHARLLDAMETTVRSRDAEIVDRSYTLTKNGAKLFGSWTIANGVDRRFMVGFRNSIDASMSVGFCSGLYVIVCSNMMFSGDFKTFRKHTNGLTDDLLTQMACNTWDAIATEQKSLQVWHDSLKDVSIRENDVDAISFRAIKAGILTPNKIKPFLECINEEKRLAEEFSVHTFHSGMTRLMRNDNLFSIASSTPRLKEFCDAEVRSRQVDPKPFWKRFFSRA